MTSTISTTTTTVASTSSNVLVLNTYSPGIPIVIGNTGKEGTN